jgi:hypothetical protein
MLFIPHVLCDQAKIDYEYIVFVFFPISREKILGFDVIVNVSLEMYIFLKSIALF